MPRLPHSPRSPHSLSYRDFFPHRGRGATGNPSGRFERLHVEWEAEAMEDLRLSEMEPGSSPEEPVCGAWRPPPRSTECFVDDTKSVLTRNESPDLGFSVSLNPYRGCEHGCSYCYARPYHEYLGFSPGLDFESRIMVKPEAPSLLHKELASPRWNPEPIACSGVTDCYQPVERQLRITRACLEVLADFRQPVGIVTKNRLVTRDVDLLQSLARHRAATVVLSLTTLDRDLSARMEPRASLPAARLEAMQTLSEAGIPVGVSVAPVIPGLNDHEIPALLAAAREHGACFACRAVLRLPHGMPELFFAWLDSHFPDKRERVERSLREVRGGALDDSRFGHRMQGSGPLARSIHRLFEVAARRAGFRDPRPELTSHFFRVPHEEQLHLW